MITNKCLIALILRDWNLAKHFVYSKPLCATIEKHMIRYVTLKCSDIQFLGNPSEKVCLAAISRNALSIQYIENPSESVCVAAVKKAGGVIQHIENPTEETLRVAANSPQVYLNLNDQWTHYDALKELI